MRKSHFLLRPESEGWWPYRTGVSVTAQVTMPDTTALQLLNAEVYFPFRVMGAEAETVGAAVTPACIGRTARLSRRTSRSFSTRRELGSGILTRNGSFTVRLLEALLHV
ncbi:Hypothetical protein Deide_3p00473 (plasmid) [Deinococcus deserti VCD115]|uniref:Uncharacterized protein n=1 Tax=Deinococcus deserti (strain DSM 17065 / CIP 109153 / LMG 22923 / VCD115) TaxID=546414 RepID=C1D488_DEIDV|nr:Hypothetical protein Deide_3p00473 [Deinococcus deserti VCD115]